MNAALFAVITATALTASTGEPPHEPATHAPEHGANDGHGQPAEKSKPSTKTESKAQPKQRVEIITPAREPARTAKPAESAHQADPHETPQRAAPKAAHSPVTESDSGPSADEALSWLQEGNAHWIADNAENPNTAPARRKSVAEKGQRPFATIITCADSRLPVERIFDRGVGELFVVRVAGNIAGDSETGTTEYAVEHLKTPLIVVMGHTRCGAVAAAASGAQLHGSLGTLVARITPAVDRARRLNPDAADAELVSAAVRENVWQTTFDLLKNSAEVRTAVSSGQVRLVGAVCDIASGKVEFLGEHPWQGEILGALGNQGANDAHAEVKDHE